MDELKKRCEVQIFATDLDNEAIEVARAGLYPEGITVDVRKDRLKRFFTREDGLYRVNKTIREMVVFATQNVIKDAPFTKLDLLSCRNLLIYLNADLQRRLMPLSHYALKPGGFLFLGTSETVSGAAAMFKVVDRKWKIFASKKTASKMVGGVHGFFNAPAKAEPSGALARRTVDHAVESHLSVLAERALADKYVPASVIVNDAGDISYIHGRTGAYLEPAAGQPRHNVLDMARGGLRIELVAALRQASRRDQEVVHHDVAVRTNGESLLVNVSVTQITEPEALRGLFIITFEPVVKKESHPVETVKPIRSKKQHTRLEELDRELRHTKETLQSTVEELETTNEELKSSNEELQSTNEELQSTNEELETSKEELQSLNEELHTVNAELQCKIEDLTRTTDDVNNLLNSTDAGTLFLDRDLNIVRYTEQVQKVVKIIRSDIGRPIDDLVSNLDYDDMVTDAREVLRTLVSHEHVVPANEGWCRVRIVPYRTVENVIDGLVLTFTDVTSLKKNEQDAQHASAFAESIIDTIREPLLVVDEDLNVISANRAFCATFHTESRIVLGQRIYDLGNRQWDIAELRRLLEEILPKNTIMRDFRVEANFQEIGPRVMLLNARRLEQALDRPARVLLAIEDVTDKTNNR